jgi:hypothetical protein
MIFLVWMHVGLNCMWLEVSPKKEGSAPRKFHVGLWPPEGVLVALVLPN